MKKIGGKSVGKEESSTTFRLASEESTVLAEKFWALSMGENLGEKIFKVRWRTCVSDHRNKNSFRLSSISKLSATQ